MRNGTGKAPLPGSFRDPSGFLFFQDDRLYRQVNQVYRKHYDHLINSGLYETLVNDGLLIQHEEVFPADSHSDQAYKILCPEKIRFISYPYEWSFSQLKDAALTTLAIQKRALDFEMSLKDSSAYNIQFKDGKPLLIDTLSFEKYREGQAWTAYRQFCQHFLAPLALMSHRDVRLSQLLRVHVDGLPLSLSSSLLPRRTWFTFSLLSHIHLHARSQARYAHQAIDKSRRKMSLHALRALIDNLESAIIRLTWQPLSSEWGDYYDHTNYSDSGFAHKKEVVEKFLEKAGPEIAWDLGANTGVFSRIASEKGIYTISFDMDPATVEKNYLECKERAISNILPLLIDLTNPSSGIGWDNTERMSLVDRAPADTVIALALIHHMAISNNVPLDRLSAFFRKLCHSLIIEFIPKSDSQVQRLLSTREDVFPHYTRTAFEQAFLKDFSIQESERIADSERTLYLMTVLGG